MANERLSMRRAKEILRLKWAGGLSHRDIARSVGTSPGTVSAVVTRAKDKGLSTWEAIERLREDELGALLYDAPAEAGTVRPLPDPVWIHTERQRRGVTLELLHLEYLGEHPGGYRYTAFCEHYRRWLERRRLSMRQVHRAGEKMFVDYSGTGVEIADPQTGVVRKAEVFVAVLGASSYTFVEATWTQQLEDWTASHVRALEYFGGVAEIFVPDQLRSAVAAPHRYDPETNPTYGELARHYGAVVVPARPRKPKDKAKVERAVLATQRWILARLRKETFFSLAAVNDRIRELLEDLNGRPMKTYAGQSRRQRYEMLDQPVLRRLPSERYELALWKAAKVNIDYHVEVDRHLYSVPHTLARHKVDVRYTATTVEVLHRGERVASHRRSHEAGRFTTVPEHMPKAHRDHLEWSPSRLIRWAAKIGPSTERLVTDILESRPHPEQGYRACLGILRLGKRYGEARLEAACARALVVNIKRCRQVEAILKNGLDRLGADGLEPKTQPPAIVHDNVRGPGYYN